MSTSFYRQGLSSSIGASKIKTYAKHWATLGSGAKFSSAALDEWGTMTLEDTKLYRKLFPGLPKLPFCARPIVTHRPDLQLHNLAGYVLSLKNLIAERGVYAKVVSGKPESLSSTKDYGPSWWRPLIPTGKWVPCTSVALMKAMGTWAWSINQVGSKGSAKANDWQMRALEWYLSKAEKLLKKEAKRLGIEWGTQEYEDLAKALVMPFKDVNGFWQLCIKIAVRKDSAGLDKRSWADKVSDLNSATWSVVRKGVTAAVKKVVKSVKGGLGYLWKEFGLWILAGAVLILGIWYIVVG